MPPSVGRSWQDRQHFGCATAELRGTADAKAAEEYEKDIIMGCTCRHGNAARLRALRQALENVPRSLWTRSCSHVPHHLVRTGQTKSFQGRGCGGQSDRSRWRRRQ